MSVAPERLDGWFERFTSSHGDAQLSCSSEAVTASAGDGCAARFGVPFAPLTEGAGGADDPLRALIAHASLDRRVGILLIRRGGFAAGVAQAGRLAVSKVGTRYVQGRTAAGGQSQQRFARRRDNQASALVGAAVEVAARIVVPELARLDALVTGGDRALLAAALADPRLAGLAGLPRGPYLAVPDPRLDVLQEAARTARAVQVTITDGEHCAG